MAPRIYTIESEPVAEAYQRLLDLAGLFCARGLLVTRPGLGMSAEGRDLVSALLSFQGNERSASEWPGTDLGRGSATVLSFEVHDQSLALLRPAPGLYSWRQPHRPEDLCFLRADGSTWLASIAHESDAFLELEEAEVAIVRARAPELRISRTEED